MNITETYFIKALDNYPCDMEGAIENLNYALSYDESYAPALCLMGKIYSQDIKNYQLAEEYFIKALAADFNYTETFSNYAELLLKLNKNKELDRLMESSATIEGIDKATLYYYKAVSEERSGGFDKAIDLIEIAMTFSFSKEMDVYLEEENKRIKGKIKRTKKRKKKTAELKYRWVRTMCL